MSRIPAHRLYLSSSVSWPPLMATVSVVILNIKGGCPPRGDAVGCERDKSIYVIQVGERERLVWMEEGG